MASYPIFFHHIEGIQHRLVPLSTPSNQYFGSYRGLNISCEKSEKNVLKKSAPLTIHYWLSITLETLKDEFLED